MLNPPDKYDVEIDRNSDGSVKAIDPGPSWPGDIKPTNMRIITARVRDKFAGKKYAFQIPITPQLLASVSITELQGIAFASIAHLLPESAA